MIIVLKNVAYTNNPVELSEKTQYVGAMKLTELAAVYNDAAALVEKSEVKRFPDKNTAVRRTWEILEEAGQPPKKDTPKTTPTRRGKPRGFTFRFPVKKEIKQVRPGTNRHKLLQLLSTGKGATFEECVAKTWGQNKDWDQEKITKTTYEGIRLLHYFVGYGMRQDDQGRIKVFTN